MCCCVCNITHTAQVDSEDVVRISLTYIAYILVTFEIRTAIFWEYIKNVPMSDYSSSQYILRIYSSRFVEHSKYVIDIFHVYTHTYMHANTGCTKIYESNSILDIDSFIYIYKRTEWYSVWMNRCNLLIIK